MLESNNPHMSIRTQCRLLGINRSSLYYKANDRFNSQSLEMMKLLDEKHTDKPFYGVKKMTVFLREKGYGVGRDRVRGLLRHMGLFAIHPGPNTSLRRQDHKVYPYLLRGMSIQRTNQVWSTDITYIRLKEGFVYLVAIIDWYSRYVLSWKLSNSLDTEFCWEHTESNESFFKLVVQSNTAGMPEYLLYGGSGGSQLYEKPCWDEYQGQRITQLGERYAGLWK